VTFFPAGGGATRKQRFAEFFPSGGRFAEFFPSGGRFAEFMSAALGHADITPVTASMSDATGARGIWPERTAISKDR
jgi:hypothetical protein